MQELDRYLDKFQEKPLGSITCLVYSHHLRADDFLLAHEYVMPWPILKKISTTLTKYVSQHQPYNVFWPGYAAPTARDLKRFQQMCAEVTTLTLDIRLGFGGWVPGVATSLGAFRKTNNIHLYVHRPFSLVSTDLTQLMHSMQITHRGMTAEGQLREFILDILNAQRRKSCEHKLYVCFKEVCGSSQMSTSSGKPNCTFYIDGGSAHKFYQQAAIHDPDSVGLRRDMYSRMSLEYLQVNANLLHPDRMTHDPSESEFAASRRMRHWYDLNMEIKRREWSDRLMIRYGNESFTLYEFWASR